MLLIGYKIQDVKKRPSRTLKNFNFYKKFWNQSKENFPKLLFGWNCGIGKSFREEYTRLKIINNSRSVVIVIELQGVKK